MKKYLLFLFLLSACSKEFDISLKNNQGNGGGISTKQINGPLPVGATILNSYEVSPDQTKIVYISDEEGSGCQNIYVYTISSSTRLKITDVCAISNNRDVKLFKISPNSQKIVFLADYNVAGRDDLFSANLNDGSNRVQLNQGLGSGQQVFTNYKISDDSSKVVFVTNEITNYFNLFVNDIAGADLRRLNYNLDGPVLDFNLANSTVVYLISHVAATSVANASNPNLRKVDISATGDMQINQVYPIPAPQERGVIDFRISPDKSRVIFWGNVEGGTARELYTSSLTAVAQLRITNISAGTNPNGGIRYGGFNKSGTRALYTADQAATGVFELYQVDLNGLNNLKLNTLLASDGSEQVDTFSLAPDGSKLVYKKISYAGSDSRVDAFVVDMNSYLVSKVNTNIAMQRSVGDYVFMGTGIGYLMNKDSLSSYSAYTNSSFSLSTEEKVSQVPVMYAAGSTVSQLSYLGSNLVYVGVGNKVGLYVGNKRVNSENEIVYFTSEKSFIVLGNISLPNYGKVVYLEDNGTTRNLMITTVQ